MKMAVFQDWWIQSPCSRVLLVVCVLQHFFLVLNSIVALSYPVNSYRVETTFLKDNSSENGSIIHFIYDRDLNSFYVGGTNRIFKLSSSLEIQQELITGPKLDSIHCEPDSSNCEYAKELTDNYNKILLIQQPVNGNGHIIVCGSLFQGYCEFRDLHNISRTISANVENKKVVANEKKASTVGILVRIGLSEHVIYIGTSFPIAFVCESDEYSKFRRSSVPSLSMRKLSMDDAFDLYNSQLVSLSKVSSSLKVHDDMLEKYTIDYKSAFSVGNYTFFLSIQPSRTCQNVQSGPPVSESKISSTCISDTLFYSYVDIPLKCGNSIVYNLIQAGKTLVPGLNLQEKMLLSDTKEKHIVVGIFHKIVSANQVDSAICIYSISEIQRKMQENINLCMNGNRSVRGDDKFEHGAKCDSSGVIGANHASLCNVFISSYGRVEGILPAVSKPAIVFPNTTLTSITLTTTTNFTLAFLGTANGLMKKIVLEEKSLAKEYDTDLVIDKGYPINQDTIYDVEHRKLYLTSSRLVAKVPVENCGQYKNCSTCLGSMDPFCGWCTLENRCTLKSECSLSTQNVDRWKILTDCTAINDISPPDASTSQNVILYLSIIDLPRETNYSCVFDFGVVKPSTKGTPWNFGISCPTPNISDLDITFGPTGSRNTTLHIRSEETGQLFVSRYFTFYDCASFTSCTSCTDNKFSCDWCVYENKCTFRLNPCSNITVFSRNVGKNDTANITDDIYGHGIKKGPQFCPKINVEETGKIFIHNNTSKEILIQGSWFPEVKGTNGYQCIIGNRTSYIGEMYARAIRKTDQQLKCVLPLRSYNLPVAGKVNVSLRVIWGNRLEVESDGAYVTIYSCSKMTQGDCSWCKNFEVFQQELNCRWCNTPLRCEYRDHCQAQRSVSMCPPPLVEKVEPMKGHILGGTFITITGRNLGAKFSEIEHNTTIAGVTCKPLEHMYRPARMIVCALGPSDAGIKTGPVVILNRKFDQFQFQYLEPILDKVVPQRRAWSGGALLTLRGRPIYIGTTLAVKVNNKSCKVIRKNETDVKCILPANQKGQAMLSVLIDGNEVRRNMNGNTSFFYVADPTISNITPLRSFQSGGRNITVIGTNINIIDQPKMFIRKDNYESNATNCTVKNETHMYCLTPQLPVAMVVQYERRQRSTELMRAQIGFIMDNVQDVRDLTTTPGFQGQLQYYPDPEVYKFEPDKSDYDNVKLFKSEIVIINGKNLMVAAKREDVQVSIGTSVCNVTNLSEDQIVCNPPQYQPKPVRTYDRDDLPAVVVHIGNRDYFVGYLEYETDELLGIPIGYIIGGVAGVGLFIIVTIIVCCCIYRRQKNKTKRDFEKMRYQLDNMESNVRNECKQAFAELQTDMTDLTTEIDDGKKPLYRYDDYTFKILFPQMLDHVVLHPPIPKNGSNERHPDVAICHFSQLLQNKQFLLKFIRTLEKQKSFGIRDKSNVASLLIILYQNNLEYITEIIKALLKELVEKSVEEKHPKLMLRRTESVVEKLLANWLALCMYKNLEESTGSSLYLLYQAIKFQVVKGPVDAVTGDARYSLSEDRLLRTENRLEPVTLTLNVEYEGKKYKCRCLDCDTITQAKDKMLDVIYRNIPYSTRPSGEDLDLDWVNENKTLQDEDNLKYKDNGWKQLNMLKDYKIPNGADVVLTQYQKCRTLPRSPNGSVHSSGFSYREAVPITRNDSEIGTKYWHLVKQHDDAQTKGLSSEIYLTRLLATKGTLKQYIDDFIKTVLTANDYMAPVIKYLFDFLDDAARVHNITDPEVAYTWKCNSLLLRFWVNIIKNPDFVFDVHKTNIVDSCLSVVAQCFMDSCSTSDQNLSKDSPSNKLLFARDIPVFKRWVSQYFDDIQKMPAVSDQDLNAYLAEVSRMSTNYFTKDNALFELYNYVQKYSNEINESLEADSFTKAQQLHDRLGNVITNMEGPSNSGLAYV